MNAPSTPTRAGAILQAAALAGTLDALGATGHYLALGGKNPVMIFLYVASAALGREALGGGWGTAAGGLAFHYVIATAFTVFFFALHPRLPVLGRRPIASGLGYGAFVWAVMNLVVVLLSRAARGPFDPVKAVVAMAILMACIGLPIALLARRHQRATAG